MSDLTQEEESTYKAVEDAFFGILWTLQTTRKNPLVNLNLLSCLGGMVLDLSHMLAFFVHSMLTFYVYNEPSADSVTNLQKVSPSIHESLFLARGKILHNPLTPYARLWMGKHYHYLGNVCAIHSVAVASLSI